MPELPPERVGFANLVSDRGSYIRRQNLIQAPDGVNCNTLEAFGLLLTRQYLETLGVGYTSPLDENNELTQVVQFGKVLVPSLWDGTAYSQKQVAGGYQAMVNYRTPGGDASKFATVVSVRDVLTNRVDPNLIRDRYCADRIYCYNYCQGRLLQHTLWRHAGGNGAWADGQSVG